MEIRWTTWNKEELEMKRPKATHLEEPKVWYQMMANFMKVFLNHVRYGAEAMDVCVQDPPKSGVDLEGAW